MRVFTVVGIILSVIGGVLLVYSFTTSSGGPFDFGPQAATIAGWTLLPMGIIFTVVGTYLSRIAGRRRELIREGVPGQATILSLAETGVYLNQQPVARLQLQVSVLGRAPYVVEHKEVIPMLALGMITPGSVLPVAVDPTDPAKLAIDWAGETRARATTLVAGAVMPNTLTTMGGQSPQPNTIAAPGTVIPEGGTAAAMPGSMAGAIPGVMGLAGRGVIRTAQDLGVDVAGQKLFKLTLDVTPATGPTYQAETAGPVPDSALGRAVAGASVAIRIDPSDPKAVTVDWGA